MKYFIMTNQHTLLYYFTTMQIILNILIFCLVLFLYLHIYFHLKTSDDLEVYEIDQPSKDKFEEVCDIRQPVLCSYDAGLLAQSGKRAALLAAYGAFDVKIRHVLEPPSDDEELYTPLSLQDALSAIDKDTKGRYVLENNAEFLEETGLVKSFKATDSFLRPYLVSSCFYDYLTASNGAQTPFRYELNYRHYLLVTEGTLKVKLAPPKSSKYLYTVKDYENFEFRSPINPWLLQQPAGTPYGASFDKVKCLEINVQSGQILYIPAYWWYSLTFAATTSVCTFKYRTPMNTLAISPQLFLHILQTQNVQRKSVKKHVEKAVVVELSPATTDSELDNKLLPLTKQSLPAELQDSLEHAVIDSSEEGRAREPVVGSNPATMTSAA